MVDFFKPRQRKKKSNVAAGKSVVAGKDDELEEIVDDPDEISNKSMEDLIPSTRTRSSSSNSSKVRPEKSVSQSR